MLLLIPWYPSHPTIKSQVIFVSIPFFLKVTYGFSVSISLGITSSALFIIVPFSSCIISYKSFVTSVWPYTVTYLLVNFFRFILNPWFLKDNCIPSCLKPSFSNLPKIPAIFSISIVPLSKTPALILPITCSCDCFSRTTLSIPSKDKSLDNNKPEGPPPIMTIFVFIKIIPWKLLLLFQIYYQQKNNCNYLNKINKD